MLKGFEKNLKLTKVEDIGIFQAMLQKEEEKWFHINGLLMKSVGL